MATKHHDPCRDKSADDEPLFTVCGRDLTGPLVVEYWTDLQCAVAQHMRRTGDTAEQAVAYIRIHGFHVTPTRAQEDLPPKLVEALDCADAMRRWPHRKLAG